MAASAFAVGFKVLCISTWHRKRGLNFLSSFATKLVLFLCGTLLSSWRGRVGTYLYLYMRHVDDIVDGDVQPPVGHSVESYVERKKRTVNSVLFGDKKNVDEEEILLIHVLKNCQSHGIDVWIWLEDIWEVFLFDHEKRVSKKPAPRKKLVEMASKQDVAIVSLLASLGMNPTSEPLRFKKFQTKLGKLNGFVTRQDWLVDLFDDLAEGSINVPYEVLLKNGVDVNVLLECRTNEELFALPGLKEWYLWEVAEMQEYWDEGEKLLPELLSLFESWFIRNAIKLMFVEWKKKFERIVVL